MVNVILAYLQNGLNINEEHFTYNYYVKTLNGGKNANTSLKVNKYRANILSISFILPVNQTYLYITILNTEKLIFYSDNL